MSIPGTIQFPALSATPSPPPVGSYVLYVKTDNTIYLEDSSGNTYAFGSADFISQLTGDVSAIGPGSAVATVNFVGGQSAASVAAATVAYGTATSANTPSTLIERDSSGNFSAGTITASLNGNAATATTTTSFTGALVGDVTGTQGATVVSFVGGKTAADVASATTEVDAATPLNMASTLVMRNASGNFSAGTITASLNGNVTGNVSGSSSSFTGSLLGDVTGTQGATVVSFVGGQSAASVASGTSAANAATPSNAASTIVERDASGNFSAGTITASLMGNVVGNLTGNVTGNVSGSAGSFTGSLLGDVTGTQGATVVSFVGGQTAVAVASATVAANDATSANTPGAIVERDGSGNFSAGIITATLNGNASTSTTAVNFTGSLSGDVTGTQGATAIASTVVTGKLLTGYVPGSNTPITATDSILTAFEKLQAQIGSSVGSAITQLTGDVTAMGPGSAVATVAKIQGTTVSGTTGTVNVVFSNSPTLTGTLNGAAATFSGVVTASNITGTNSGDVTLLNTNSINLSFGSGQNNLQANLNLSAASPDAGYIPTTATIKTDGLLVEVLAGTPVNIGTVNAMGSAASAARSDHVHALTSPVVLGLPLTGYVTGTNIPITASNSILTSFENLQAQVSATAGMAITALTGDATATGPGSVALTLATVNANTGSFGSSTSIPNFAVNAKGLIITAGSNVVIAPAGTLTGTTLASNVASSSLTSVGTIVSGVWNGTPLTAPYMLALPANDIYVGNGSNQPAAVPMSGDVSVVSSGATTLQKIQGTAVSGTTGTGSVVFSASPTVTGTLTAAAINATSLTDTSLMTGSILFVGASGLITQDNANFFWNDSATSLGIGTSSPQAASVITTINSSGAAKPIWIFSYGTGSTTGIRGDMARGTAGSPTATQAGDVLNFISGRGYGASQFAAASTGVIQIVANEAFTNTSNQTYVAIKATPTDSVTSAEHFRVAGTGTTLGPQSSSTDLHTVNGGWIRTTKTITSNYTVDTTTADDIILCNQSAGITITLPTPTVGRTIVIKDISGTAQTNNITIAQHASENIEGLAASKVFQTNFGSLMLSVGSAGNWWVIG